LRAEHRRAVGEDGDAQFVDLESGNQPDGLSNEFERAGGINRSILDQVAVGRGEAVNRAAAERQRIKIGYPEILRGEQIDQRLRRRLHGRTPTNSSCWSSQRRKAKLLNSARSSLKRTRNR
jgi:hypothetical protein